MKQLTNALKKMLDGLAAADAGEYLTARQKTAYLEKTVRNVVQATDPAPVLSENAVKTRVRRRVAMYLGSELPAAMMDYIIETCTSLDHDLTIVTFEAGRVVNTLMTPYKERLAENNIAVETAKLSGEPIKGLARYLRSHSEIAFLACKNTGYLGNSYMNGTQLTNTIPVPVVVVVVDPAATDTQPAEQAEQESKIGAA